MSESEIEGKVVEWAKSKDILPLKLTPVSDGGWPDHFWLFYYPAVAFIEFKAPEGRVALRQGLRIAELKRRGYPVEVIRSVEQGIAFLEATILSGNGCKAWNLPSVRGVFDVPGDGKDDHPVRDLQNLEGQEFR